MDRTIGVSLYLLKELKTRVALVLILATLAVCKQVTLPAGKTKSIFVLCLYHFLLFITFIHNVSYIFHPVVSSEYYIEAG